MESDKLIYVKDFDKFSDDIEYKSRHFWAPNDINSTTVNMTFKYDNAFIIFVYWWEKMKLDIYTRDIYFRKKPLLMRFDQLPNDLKTIIRPHIILSDTELTPQSIIFINKI